MCDKFCYNGAMVLFLKFASHLLFIYMAHQLLTKVVDWHRFLKGTAENQRKIQLFVLFLAIALGYLVSNFFLDLMTIGRTFSDLLTQ